MLQLQRVDLAIKDPTLVGDDRDGACDIVTDARFVAARQTLIDNAGKCYSNKVHIISYNGLALHRPGCFRLSIPVSNYQIQWHFIAMTPACRLGLCTGEQGLLVCFEK